MRLPTLAWLALSPFLLAADTPGNQNRITRFFTANNTEPDVSWAVQNVQYQQMFSDNIGINTDEDTRYDVIGADGELCNLSLSLKSGALTGANSGAIATVRKIAGGDVAGGTWTDTPMAVKIVTDGGRRDTHWSYDGCIPVSRGDAVQLQWDTGPAATDWPDGSVSEPKIYVEFRSKEADTFFMSALTQTTNGYSKEFLFSILGATEEAVQVENVDLVAAPLPAAFTLTGLSVTFHEPPEENTTVAICVRDGKGNDGACGGKNSGTSILSCRIDTTQSQCAKTGSVALSAGDRVYVGIDENDTSSYRTIATRWTSPTHQWFSGGAYENVREGRKATTLNHGRNAIQCNDFVREDPVCAVRLPRAWTAKSMRGYMPTAIATNSLDIALRANGKDTALEIEWTSGQGTTADRSADVELAAGDWFSIGIVPVSRPSGGADFQATVLWADGETGD